MIKLFIFLNSGTVVTEDTFLALLRERVDKNCGFLRTVAGFNNEENAELAVMVINMSHRSRIRQEELLLARDLINNRNGPKAVRVDYQLMLGLHFSFLSKDKGTLIRLKIPHIISIDIIEQSLVQDLLVDICRRWNNVVFSFEEREIYIYVVGAQYDQVRSIVLCNAVWREYFMEIKRPPFF